MIENSGRPQSVNVRLGCLHAKKLCVTASELFNVEGQTLCALLWACSRVKSENPVVKGGYLVKVRECGQLGDGSPSYYEVGGLSSVMIAENMYKRNYTEVVENKKLEESEKEKD